MRYAASRQERWLRVGTHSLAHRRPACVTSAGCLGRLGRAAHLQAAWPRQHAAPRSHARSAPLVQTIIAIIIYLRWIGCRLHDSAGVTQGGSTDCATPTSNTMTSTERPPAGLHSSALQSICIGTSASTSTTLSTTAHCRPLERWRDMSLCLIIYYLSDGAVRVN